MKISIINKSDSSGLQYTLEHYPLVSDILDESLKEFIQKSFESHYSINDIDIKNEDYSYSSYISNEEILIVRDSEGKPLAFSLFQRIELLESMGLFLFLGSNTSPKLFQNLLKHFFLTFVHLKKDISNYIYFDTKHIGVYNWIKEFVPTLKIIKIREEYYVCYAKTDSKYINKIILNNYEFKKCLK